jgi:hypothetical protein
MEEIVVEKILRVTPYIQPAESYEPSLLLGTPVLLPSSFILKKLVEFEGRDGRKYTANIREGVVLEPGNRVIMEKSSFFEVPQVESEDGLKYKIKSIERV